MEKLCQLYAVISAPGLTEAIEKDINYLQSHPEEWEKIKEKWSAPDALKKWIKVEIRSKEAK